MDCVVGDIAEVAQLSYNILKTDNLKKLSFIRPRPNRGAKGRCSKKSM